MKELKKHAGKAFEEQQKAVSCLNTVLLHMSQIEKLTTNIKNTPLRQKLAWLSLELTIDIIKEKHQSIQFLARLKEFNKIIENATNE